MQIKSNMGHCEPASCIAGVMKSALALENGVVPPLWSLETINPNRKTVTGGSIRTMCTDMMQSISDQRV